MSRKQRRRTGGGAWRGGNRDERRAIGRGAPHQVAQPPSPVSVSDLDLATAERRVPFWLWALGVTSLMQATSALLTGTLPVIGPILTAAAGVPPERVGDLTAMSSLGTMLFLIAG